MAIYSKTTKQMLVDLINKGNPQLPFPINETDFEFTQPEVIADPGNGHNTRLRVIAKPNTNYTGNVVLTYRRLNVGNVFRNMTLFVQKWVANNGQASGNLTTLRDLYPLFSEKYGFNFIPEEWADRTLTGYNGVRGDTFAITPVAENPAFVGSITARWDIGERTLESLLPVDQVSGRKFPGGNTFDTVGAPHKYWTLPDGFDLDHTLVATNLESSWLTDYQFGQWQNTSVQSLHGWFVAQVLSKVVPRANEWGLTAYVARPATAATGNVQTDESFNYKTKVGGLNGLKLVRYTLPHASFPEANSEFFNRVLVLSFPDDCPWATGNLYFHYNV